MGITPSKWWEDAGTLSTWEDLISFDRSFSNSLEQEWIFRGHIHAAFHLAPSLERAFGDFDIKADRRSLENVMIVEFKRHYHRFATTALPQEGDTLAYIALMRHYGAPTRLLDFTFSIFVAAYFASEAAAGPASIWAVNKTWLTKTAHACIVGLPDGKALLEGLGRRGVAFEDVYLKNMTGPAFIGPVGPSFMNDRQGAQQGLFLCPTDLTVSFESILANMPGSTRNVRRIDVLPKASRELISRLQRVNISRASLFPGLGGFAESLRTKLLLFEQMAMMTKAGGRIGPNIMGV